MSQGFYSQVYTQENRKHMCTQKFVHGCSKQYYSQQPQRGNSNVHLGCDIVIQWNLILLIKIWKGQVASEFCLAQALISEGIICHSNAKGPIENLPPISLQLLEFLKSNPVNNLEPCLNLSELSSHMLNEGVVYVTLLIPSSFKGL